MRLFAADNKGNTIIPLLENPKIDREKTNPGYKLKLREMNEI